MNDTSNLLNQLRIDRGNEPTPSRGRIWLLAKRDAWRQVSSPPPLVEVARDQDVKEGYLLLARPEMVPANGAAPPGTPPASGTASAATAPPGAR